MTESDSKTVPVTVWSDIGCPWATLALHTLRAAARDRGVALEVTHRSFPLELFNSQPTPRQLLDPEIVAIGGLRAELGWQCWRGEPSSYPVTMLPAMAAVRAVAATDGSAAADELDAALRHAFFAESRCVSLYSVIREVADGCALVNSNQLEISLATGVGQQSVFDDWQAAQDGGVQGSPHLFARDLSLPNPGVTMSWSGEPGASLPRLDSYDPGWVDQILS